VVWRRTCIEGIHRAAAPLPVHIRARQGEGGCAEVLENNLYRILQVDPAAEQDVIAAAYQALDARLHPEKDISGVQEHRKRELDRAYAVLGDPAKRRVYDAQRAAQAQIPVGPGADGDHRYGGSLADRVQARTADPEHLAEITLDFGRYAGWTLGDLLRTDPEYLQWLSRHSSGIRYRGAILRLLAARDGQGHRLRVPR
jgi:curved DNA-binding protein CbpA